MSVAEGVNPETLVQQAQHESGHAIASWALGIPFQRVTLSDSQGRPRCEPIKGNRVMVGQHWLMMCCGAIADQQRRGLRMRGSQIVKLILGGGADEFFEVDDAETGQVVLRRVSRIPAVSRGGDLHDMATSLPRDFPDPTSESIRIWRDSERFAAECRPAIDALAAALLARGELNYDEAAEIAVKAMVGKPAPVIPEWARR